MPNILAVLHRRQETNAGCLPACAQMILNYLFVPAWEEMDWAYAVIAKA